MLLQYSNVPADVELAIDMLKTFEVEVGVCIYQPVVMSLNCLSSSAA
jgi:hypothetical protein